MTRKKFYPENNIRRSQLLTPFGIGALFDINNQTVMIADSEFWNKDHCKIIHDPRLQEAMGARGFIEPPISDDTESTDYSSISGIRFPQWYLSPFTRKIMPITQWRQLAVKLGRAAVKRFDEHPFDSLRPKMHEELVPVRFLCVCPEGHMQDFPWIEWAHQGEICEKPDMELLSGSRSGSLADYTVRCRNCKRKKSLSTIFYEKGFSEYLKKINVSCKGQHIWEKDSEEKSCKGKLQVLLRSANNLYFPNISSSVNIPFTSVVEAIKSDESGNVKYKALKELIQEDSAKKSSSNKQLIQLFTKQMVDEVKTKFPKKSEDQIRTEVMRDLNPKDSFSNDDVKVMDYRREEFNILSGITKYDNNSDKLKETIFNKNDLMAVGLSQSISHVSLVHQLEVVSALRSFSRLKPTDSDSMKEIIREEGENTDFSKEISLKRNDDKYYVGMRSHGEGIFISLDNSQISSWMERIQGSSIAERINKKVNNKGVFKDEIKYITPDYYLLHTLSHIILRELSISSGYSSTALKERLYYSDELGQEMYGILIYTSSSDSEGTLGGLVKQGVPDRLKWILSAAIEKARWCSFDPVCIDSEGQGSDSLNASACHACALISETSCEKRNQFLDRGVLIGTLDEPDLGFFSKD